jgi:hypothetical protein
LHLGTEDVVVEVITVAMVDETLLAQTVVVFFSNSQGFASNPSGFS